MKMSVLAPGQTMALYRSLLTLVAISLPICGLVGCGSKPTATAPVKATVVGTGVISGRVLLEGTPPQERELPLDPNCKESCKLHHGEGPRFTRVYVTKEGGLADVLVSVVGIPPQPIPDGTRPLEINQTGCEYTPYVSACQVGQPIKVLNNDPLLHNIHTLPKVSGNPEINKSQSANAAPLEFVYHKPEEFLQFKCDVHPWMFAYVSVLEHPFFAVTAEDGNFQIKGLPDGEYQVKFKHRKAGEVTQQVEVKEGVGKVEVELKVVGE